MVVALYLIAQMVGAGKLIQLLFGLHYHVAVILVVLLMVLICAVRRHASHYLGQIIKAALLLAGASFMALMVMKSVSFDFNTLFAEAVKAHPKGIAIMSPGGLVTDPISALSLGLSANVRHCRPTAIFWMRFFTVSDAKEAHKSVFYATGFIGYFYILTFIIGFGAILLVSANTAFKDTTVTLLGGTNMAAVHLANSEATSSSALSRQSPSPLF